MQKKSLMPRNIKPVSRNNAKNDSTQQSGSFGPTPAVATANPQNNQAALAQQAAPKFLVKKRN